MYTVNIQYVYLKSSSKCVIGKINSPRLISCLHSLWSLCWWMQVKCGAGNIILIFICMGDNKEGSWAKEEKLGLHQSFSLGKKQDDNEAVATMRCSFNRTKKQKTNGVEKKKNPSSAFQNKHELCARARAFTRTYTRTLKTIKKAGIKRIRGALSAK